MKDTTCRICGRYLRHTKGWQRWLRGPYCSGSDVEECMRIQTVRAVNRMIEEYESRHGQ